VNWSESATWREGLAHSRIMVVMNETVTHAVVLQYSTAIARKSLRVSCLVRPSRKWQAGRFIRDHRLKLLYEIFDRLQALYIIISAANIDGIIGCFLCSNDEDEVILR